MVKLEPNCLIVTRDKQIYWVVTFEDNDLHAYCLSTSTSVSHPLFNLIWDKETLLARREGPHIDTGYIEEPRTKDIIYVFKITDYFHFLNVIRNVRFLTYQHLINYTRNQFCERVFERIDGQFD